MGFNKIRLGVEEIFTIIITDVDGRKVGKWTILKRDLGSVLKILVSKYSLNFSVISKDKDKDLDKDLDWAI